jgi:hypothetical protein
MIDKVLNYRCDNRHHLHSLPRKIYREFDTAFCEDFYRQKREVAQKISDKFDSDRRKCKALEFLQIHNCQQHFTPNAHRFCDFLDKYGTKGLNLHR